jgi:hypothetical protein
MFVRNERTVQLPSRGAKRLLRPCVTPNGPMASTSPASASAAPRGSCSAAAAAATAHVADVAALTPYPCPRPCRLLPMPLLTGKPQEREAELGACSSAGAREATSACSALASCALASKSPLASRSWHKTCETRSGGRAGSPSSRSPGCQRLRAALARNKNMVEGGILKVKSVLPERPRATPALLPAGARVPVNYPKQRLVTPLSQHSPSCPVKSGLRSRRPSSSATRQFCERASELTSEMRMT